MLARAALTLHAQHPEVTSRWDALLRSINERLGALLPPDVDAGGDLPPLGTAWLGELAAFAEANGEDTRDAIDESRHGPDG